MKASRATISGFPVHRVGEAGNKSAIYSFSSHVAYVAPSFPFPVLLRAGSQTADLAPFGNTWLVATSFPFPVLLGAGSRLIERDKFVQAKE